MTDTPGVADVLEGDYVSGGDDLIRTEPLDCKVGSSDTACDGDPRGTAGTGGYTYGDFGKIIGRPEVHAASEIWSQTLWDLRDALGSTTVEGIVTRAMELAPSNPSQLDMRNSILQADLVANGGANHDTIWTTFAHRGMGYFAGAVDATTRSRSRTSRFRPSAGSPASCSERSSTPIRTCPSSARPSSSADTRRASRTTSPGSRTRTASTTSRRSPSGRIRRCGRPHPATTRCGRR